LAILFAAVMNPHDVRMRQAGTTWA
jgi:hypothetical protein